MKAQVMTEELTRDLIEKVRAGHRDAFDRVSERFRHRLLAFIRPQLGKHLRDRVDEEDVLQETLLKAYESIAAFRWEGEESFFGWLCGIARNAILRQTRRYLQIEAAEVDEEILAPGNSPSRVMRRDERWHRLREALKNLSADHRQVITLSRIEGVPVSEIAERMNRSPKAVYQLLWRALQKLRESFGDTESLHLPDRNLSSGSF